jgi:hypothetical protein
MSRRKIDSAKSREMFLHLEPRSRMSVARNFLDTSFLTWFEPFPRDDLFLERCALGEKRLVFVEFR